MAELTITVTVADRNYRLTIDTAEEEVIRKAARTLDEQIKAYAGNFGYKDKQDLLAMVALHFAIATLNHERELQFRDTQLTEKLQKIDQVLSDYLP